MNGPVAPGPAPASLRRPAGAGGRLVGVGVGPGDPGLLTRKAMEVLAAADRVVAPVTAGAEPGRAERVVAEALPDLAITRLPFDMTPDSATEPGGGSGAATRAASTARHFYDACRQAGTVAPLEALCRRAGAACRAHIGDALGVDVVIVDFEGEEVVARG